MITIEKAIKHCEEVAEEQVRLYRLCPSEYDCNGLSDCKALADGRNKGCLKRANENRQLAEWLKKLNLLIQEITEFMNKEEEVQDYKEQIETIEYNIAKCCLLLDYIEVGTNKNEIKRILNFYSSEKEIPEEFKERVKRGIW